MHDLPLTVSAKRGNAMRASSLIALAFASLVFTASVAHADGTAATAADAARTSDVKAGTDDDDKVVCEYEKRVGSHMKTRVCKTVAERRREEEKAQKLMESRAICSSGCNR
jgi:hypothetical protein